MKICGIVGWKNSGKTYLAQKLISYFSYKNYQVASIKHAHDNFDIDKPATDSYLHRSAGAKQVIISSSNRWAKITEIDKSKEKNLFDLIDSLEFADIVIVEGFKNEKHSKIEIIGESDSSQKYLFKELQNVIGIVSNIKIDSDVKQFKKNEIESIAKHIIENC